MRSIASPREYATALNGADRHVCRVRPDRIQQQARGCPLDLRRAERCELEGAHTSRERVHGLRPGEYVGRSGQQELPGRPVVVDDAFQGERDIRNPLDLGDDDRFPAPLVPLSIVGKHRMGIGLDG